MRMHEFQRDVALQSAVTRAIDDAHAALAERLEDFRMSPIDCRWSWHGAQGETG